MKAERDHPVSAAYFYVTCLTLGLIYKLINND
jgi:hypothetical protein